MSTCTAARSTTRHAESGFSLIEMLVAMGIFTLIMGVTMAGLSDVIKGNQMVLETADTNNGARAAMDLMVRDFLQVGSGLPGSHSVMIPNGTGAQTVRIPGPPGTAFTTLTTDATLPAVIARPRTGPVGSGGPTDSISVLMADNTFVDVQLSAVAATSVTVVNGTNLTAGADRVTPGQLMMISKGSFNILVSVTAVNGGTRQLTFADGDALRINQSAAAGGNLAWLNAQAPVNSAASTRISRVRMITYYLDATTDPGHPRLVRRVNNGDPMTFNNALGTAVALDITDLQFAFDISNGAGNPGDVEMVQADLDGTGACAPNPCAATQIRKVNVSLTARSSTPVPPRNDYMYNALRSQVSLRGMAFVDRYR